MDFSSVKTTVDAVARLVNNVMAFTGHVSPKSYTDLAKLTSVEPLTIVSPDCFHLEYMPAISQAACALFSGYYLQAIDVLASVHDVEVVKILDKLNPNRDSTGFLVMDNVGNGGNAIRTESLRYSLPQPGMKPRMEAGQNNLQEAVNMAVGRMLDVTINLKNADGNDVKTSLKVAVRLKIASVPETAIISLLSNGTVDRGVEERFHAWRSGAISFIRDIILAEDIIREKMKMAVEDPTGTGAEVLRRVSKNRAFGVLTNNPSLATASNIVIMSEEVAAQVGYRAGGKLTDANTREKVFNNSYALIMIVVDKGTGRCKFFIRGQSDYATLSKKEIEFASKGKGADPMEIFRALQTSSFSNF